MKDRKGEVRPLYYCGLSSSAPRGIVRRPHRHLDCKADQYLSSGVQAQIELPSYKGKEKDAAYQLSFVSSSKGLLLYEPQLALSDEPWSTFAFLLPGISGKV